VHQHFRNILVKSIILSIAQCASSQSIVDWFAYQTGIGPASIAKANGHYSLAYFQNREGNVDRFEEIRIRPKNINCAFTRIRIKKIERAFTRIKLNKIKIKL
jgi:hypothetical protein